MAMFDSSGDMRVAKAKSTLKRQLQVEATMRHMSKNSSVIIDISAMLWVISWPIRMGKSRIMLTLLCPGYSES